MYMLKVNIRSKENDVAVGNIIIYLFVKLESLLSAFTFNSGTFLSTPNIFLMS